MGILTGARRLARAVLAASVIAASPMAAAADLRAPVGGDVPRALLGHRGAVLVFWATWCPHCLADLSAFARLNDEAAACGLPLIGVPMDVATRHDMVLWLRRQGVAWPQVFDGRGFSGPIPRRHRIHAVPHIVIVDTRGRGLAAGLDLRALRRELEAQCATGVADS